MSHIKIAVWSVITGLTLGMLPVQAVAGDAAEAAVTRGRETQDEQSPTVPASGEQAGKLIPESTGQRPTSPLQPDLPVYILPLGVGAPEGIMRRGGVRQATPGVSSELFVLAPDHTGLTVQEQPSLYWYLSQSTTYPIEFTIIEDQQMQVKPLLEKPLHLPAQSGVQRIRLADYNVHLSLGVQYRWSVVLIVDPDNRSKDIFAEGIIKRVEADEALRAKLEQTRRADPSHLPYVYAQQGLWYDAVTAISDSIDATPHDATLRQQRAALLRQIGLGDVADYDLR